MEISVKPEFEQFISERVESGEFSDANSLVNAAIALLKRQREEDAGFGDWTPEELQQELAPALASLDRGEGTAWSLEEAKADRDRLLAQEREGHVERH